MSGVTGGVLQQVNPSSAWHYIPACTLHSTTDVPSPVRLDDLPHQNGEAMVGFDTCRAAFESSSSTQALYNWTGPVFGGRDINGSYIKIAGCEALCGKGPHFHVWNDISATAANWVFPILGVLTGAPFDSNQTWGTVKLLCRWLGSPFICLSSILWSIKMTSRGCLLLDMSVPCDYVPDEHGSFAALRDSLYVLDIMSQYDTGIINQSTLRTFRVALFSDECPPGATQSLVDTRAALARALRATRRRGIVPVYVSLLWLILCLSFSIEDGMF